MINILADNSISNRKIKVIEKLINELTEKCLRVKSETLKAGYNTLVFNLNDQKIRIQKLLKSNK